MDVARTRDLVRPVFLTTLSMGLLSLVACKGSSDTPSLPDSAVLPSQALSATELQSIAGSIFGDIAKNTNATVSKTGTAPKTIRSLTPQTVTVQIAQSINDHPSCPLGGYVQSTGSVTGSANTDTNLVNISGTVLISHNACSYIQGQEISGDPYMTGLLTYTATGAVDSLTLTLSGSYAVKINGRGTTHVQTDASGIRLTMGTTAPCRIQGSLTATPGGSFSVSQGC